VKTVVREADRFDARCAGRTVAQWPVEYVRLAFGRVGAQIARGVSAVVGLHDRLRVRDRLGPGHRFGFVVPRHRVLEVLIVVDERLVAAVLDRVAGVAVRVLQVVVEVVVLDEPVGIAEAKQEHRGDDAEQREERRQQQRL